MSRSIRHLIPACMAMLLLGGCALSSAHSDEWLEHHTPHGGQLKDCGPYRIELTNKGDNLLAYVYHSGSFKEVSTVAWSAGAVTLSQGKRGQTTMQPAGGNVLQGDAVALNDPKRVVILAAYPRGGRTCTVRFTPGTVTAPASKP